jgi:hypothetical protein
MALKDKAHQKRKALLLEKDFRDLFDDGVFGKDVLKVTNMKDGNVTDGEFASDNVDPPSTKFRTDSRCRIRIRYR